MPPRFTIDRLPEEQFQFVIDTINSGASDREICAAFEQQFETPLAKSSLERWRKASGDELVQRYRLARYQATQLLENLEQTDADKLGVIVASVEDRLLTSMRQMKSPVGIHQRNRRRPENPFGKALSRCKTNDSERCATKPFDGHHDGPRSQS